MIQKYIESKEKLRIENEKIEKAKRIKRMASKNNVAKVNNRPNKQFNIPGENLAYKNTTNESKKRFNEMIQNATVLYNEVIE
jgi:hypothetical protein